MASFPNPPNQEQQATCNWRHLAGHELLPPACLIPIDRAGIDPACFVRHGVPCPPSIARSVPKRQAEFLFGRRAAANALAAIGFRPSEIPIGPNREPVWPSGIIGSISHNGHYAVAIAAPRVHYSGVGIDVETVGDVSSEQALLDIVVSPAEAAYLQTLVGAMPLLALLTLVFSAKESLFKGAFPSVGRYFDFSAAEVRSVDLERNCVQLALQENLSADFKRGNVYTVQFDLLQHSTILTSFAW